MGDTASEGYPEIHVDGRWEERFQYGHGCGAHG
jgi:hypothetical protein